MISDNDQIALMLLQSYLKHRDTYSWIEVNCAFQRVQLTFNKHTDQRKALDAAYQTIGILADWYKDVDIINEYNITAPIDYSIKENGVLTVLRKMFKSEKESFEFMCNSDNPDEFIPNSTNHIATLRKCLLLIQLWDMGEDITYHALSLP